MKLGKHWRFMGAAGIALSTGVANAAAPVIDAPVAPVAAESGITGDIVVTARRREERLQDVPLAISAFNSAKLEQENVVRVEDLARIAPGFVVQASPFGNAALTITLRSQRQNLPNLTYDPSVGLYFAEVVQMRAQGANGALYDLESVQVLKGPQGTLFGRNTTGGAVLFTPRAPSDTLGGYGKVGFGDYAMFQVEGAVNVPISDALQVRIAGRHSEHKGYTRVLGTKNRVDDENVDSFRASIRFTPSDGFTNTLVVDRQYQDGAGTGFKVIAVNPTGLANTLKGIGQDVAALAGQPFHTTTSDVALDGTRIRGWTVSNITTADVGDVTLKNIAGYRHVDSFISFDIDGSSKDVLSATERMKAHQVSDEVQILGKGFDDSLDYILGAYFFEEGGPDRQLTPTLGAVSDNDIHVTNRSYSLFGQATYKLPWVDGLSLTAGVRQTWDSREMTSRSKRVGICRLTTADVGGVPLNPCEKTVKADFDSLTYNLSVDWKINSNLLVYVAHRKGYRAGGFANAASLPSEFAPYQPETVKDVELGLKSDWTVGDIVGRTNIAVYRGDYRDIQRNVTDQVADPNNPSVIFTRSTIVNAARGVIKGFEIEQMIRPFDALELNLSYALSDAKYKRFVLANGLDYTKSPFAGAPRNILSASARLKLPVPETAGDVFAQVSGAYRSSSIFADVSSFNPVTQQVYPNARVPAYTTFDARVDWERVLDTRFSISAFVRNLTDKNYIQAGQDVTGLGFTAVMLGSPRTFGFEAKYEF